VRVSVDPISRPGRLSAASLQVSARTSSVTFARNSPSPRRKPGPGAKSPFGSRDGSRQREFQHGRCPLRHPGEAISQAGLWWAAWPDTAEGSRRRVARSLAQGHASRVGTVSTKRRNRVPPCSAQLGAKAADGPMRLAPKREACLGARPGHQRPSAAPATLLLRPKPRLHKPVKWGRKRTLFSAGRKPTVASRSARPCAAWFLLDLGRGRECNPSVDGTL